MNQKQSGPITGGNQGQGQDNRKQLHCNSLAAQQQRLLAALQRGPVSTLEARADLDILHPAGRAKELRRMGYRIETHWIERPTDCGKLHRVGEYILAVEPGA